MFSKIVVGIDGSEMAETALKLVCELPSKYESELHLVHTPQPKTVAFAMGAMTGYHAVTTMPSEDQVKKAGEKVLNGGKAIAKANGQTIMNTYMALGDPAEEITNCVEKPALI
jgi:nucleotide-binding universal stress UspA family protein